MTENKLTDVVYILGTGSESNDLEILYSLRSLQINMQDMGKVFVVGHCPDFLQNVIHIEADDPHVDKWRNALHKTRKVCGEDTLSDDFLLMNDDFYALEPFLGATVPFYAVKTLKTGPFEPKDYTIHAPILLNKHAYIKMPLSEDQAGTFSPRSFYCSIHNAPPTYTHDFIVRHGTEMPDFDTQTIGWPFFSISNGTMLDPDFKQWLENLYPIKSRYEV